MVLLRGSLGYGRVRLLNEVSVGVTAIDQLMSFRMWGHSLDGKAFLPG
jgi:hypothetical protein